ncbi:MAG: DUF5665 domain-containing protein [Clostridium sp.]
MKNKEDKERLIKILEEIRIKEYVALTENKWKLFMINFISGVGKGLGYAVGFSMLSGFLLYIIASSVDIPVIGEHIAKFLDIINSYRIGG